MNNYKPGNKSLFHINVINNTSLNIHAGNYVFLDETWKLTNNQNPFTRLYFVKDGKGSLETNNETVFMEPENAYLIPADLKFSGNCTYLEKIFFHITAQTFEGYDIFSEINKICTIPFPEEEFCELLRCFYSDNYFDYLRLKMILTRTILKIIESYSIEKSTIVQYSELVKKIISYISANLRSNLSIAMISDALFVSQSKIRNVFKAEMGMPLGAYIDDMVFIDAKKQLSQKHLTIAEISYNLGFCDQFYFSRRFRQKFGVTPSEFRKNSIE